MADAPRTVSPLWQEASHFAQRAHRHQLRKDGRTPYASHVTRVALTVAVVFGCTDETVLAAALLHDTIEDTTTDFEDIEERFGAEVAKIVANLTNLAMLPEAQREEEYFGRLRASCWRTKLVKLADAYDNVSDVESFPHDEQATRRHKTREKARRALEVAEPEASDHAIVSKAAAVLRGALGER
ncbi:MAG: HD domain-containing protein [Planctomycetota bacterium]|nr:HD domain-containing protein [Planctomycetota bacterium]